MISFFFNVFLLLSAELDQDRLKWVTSFSRHALCSQQHPEVLQLTISMPALQHSAWSEYTEEQQQENEGETHKEAKICAGTWEWMVNFNWRNLKQFLQEKAGSVFP